jgi:hypothetical protein
MATEFFDSFNAVLPEMEAAFTEDWIFNDVTYPAIAIDHEADSTRVMKGGVYQDVNTTIYVRKAVFDSSGVSQDDIITARGQDFTVLVIEQEGDDCRTLICGSPQIDVWKS